MRQDLIKKVGWSDLRPVLLHLPPDDYGARGEEVTADVAGPLALSTEVHARCNTANAIEVAVLEEDKSDRVGYTAKKIVFAVNAGCPLPTGRSAGDLWNCCHKLYP